MQFPLIPTAIAIGCAVFLAACNKAPEPSAATPVEAAAEQPAGAAAAGTEQGDPLAVLVINPNPIDLCGQEKKITSVVADWDLSKTKVRNYHVWVEAPTQARKLWFSSYKPTGSKKTGNWVRANTKFTITTPDGKLVASTVVAASACD